jgi:hypothetical protein
MTQSGEAASLPVTIDRYLVGLSLLVVRAQTRPLSELDLVRHADQVCVVLLAQPLHDLVVVTVVAVLGQEAEQALTRVEDLARLAQTAVKRVGVPGKREMSGGKRVGRASEPNSQSLAQRLLDGLVHSEFR